MSVFSNFDLISGSRDPKHLQPSKASCQLQGAAAELDLSNIFCHQKLKI